MGKLICNLPTERYESVAKQVEAIRIAKGCSQNQLPQHLLVGQPSVYSNLGNGKFNAVGDSMLQKIEHKLRELSGEKHEWQFYRTINYNVIEELCDEARNEKKMIAITGYTGAGKTYNLKHYVGENDKIATEKGSVFFVQADFLMNATKFLKAVAKAMGADASGKAHEVLDRIEELYDTKRGSLRSFARPLLIIDEAVTLKDECWRMLKLIYDKTEGKMGIVLAGTERMKSYLQKGADADKLNFREIKRRITQWSELEMPDIHEVRDLCEREGINHKAMISELHTTFTDYGSLKHQILSSN